MLGIDSLTRADALQIFGYLIPLDILHLSWTSKGLHDVLARRSAQCVWQRARANVRGLPECPDDLTEAAYARLVFDAHCQVYRDQKFRRTKLKISTVVLSPGDTQSSVGSTCSLLQSMCWKHEIVCLIIYSLL
jgi:hypothetical protein